MIIGDESNRSEKSSPTTGELRFDSSDLSNENRVEAVELFCGIGGFRIACENLGIQTVWANDINELSCDVYRSAFGGGEIREGDIATLQGTIPTHQLLTAGFPCQPFSSAGKKLGIRDPRGTLFEEIVKVLRSHNTKWFVLENVKRLLTMEHGDHFATILKALSELDYLIEWRLFKATDFGLPQNRQRLVIVGASMSTLDEARVILASESDLANTVQADFSRLTNYLRWDDLTHHNRKFPNWGMCFKGSYYCADLESFSEAKPLTKLTSLLEGEPDSHFFMDDTMAERIDRSVFVNRLVDGVRILYNQKGGARMGYTVFGVDGIAPALTASHSRHYERYMIGDRFRRLTNVEYARLQGFPDQHCANASIFNQYGLYGNAVPPPMMEWVIARLVGEMGTKLSAIQPAAFAQMSLFQ